MSLGIRWGSFSVEGEEKIQSHLVQIIDSRLMICTLIDLLRQIDP